MTLSVTKLENLFTGKDYFPMFKRNIYRKAVVDFFKQLYGVGK
jgi:hypothetical protein